MKIDRQEARILWDLLEDEIERCLVEYGPAELWTDIDHTYYDKIILLQAKAQKELPIDELPIWIRPRCVESDNV